MASSPGSPSQPPSRARARRSGPSSYGELPGALIGGAMATAGCHAPACRSPRRWRAPRRRGRTPRARTARTAPHPPGGCTRRVPAPHGPRRGRPPARSHRARPGRPDRPGRANGRVLPAPPGGSPPAQSASSASGQVVEPIGRIMPAPRVEPAPAKPLRDTVTSARPRRSSTCRGSRRPASRARRRRRTKSGCRSWVPLGHSMTAGAVAEPPTVTPPCPAPPAIRSALYLPWPEARRDGGGWAYVSALHSRVGRPSTRRRWTGPCGGRDVRLAVDAADQCAALAGDEPVRHGDDPGGLRRSTRAAPSDSAPMPSSAMPITISSASWTAPRSPPSPWTPRRS